MRKSTAVAHANLAFVKYWGKIDHALNLPANNSISMNLSNAKTTTSVQFDESLFGDEILIGSEGRPANPSFSSRVSNHLDRIRKEANVTLHAHVWTENSFATGVGIASSASGFAALTMAACHALELDLSEKELSILARKGSGSACRSIPSGFVEWFASEKSEESFARQIAKPDHWDILDITIAVSQSEKKMSSSAGHKLTTISPFFPTRLATLPERLNLIRRAILDRDFETFGQEVETEAISLHLIAMSSPHKDSDAWLSGVYYWMPDTLELLIATQDWRKDGLQVYFTLDAGPTVHLICPDSEKDQLLDAVSSLQSQRSERLWNVMVNRPAEGAYIMNQEEA